MDLIFKSSKSLVKSIAKKQFLYSGRINSNEYEDYIQYGYIGLLEAATKFEGDISKFHLYAKKRIKGSIIDGVYGKKIKEIIKIIDIDEVEEKYLTCNESCDNIITRDVRRRISSIIEEKLNNSERKVIKKIYYEDKTVSEIAKIYKITTSRVCQIHKNAITKLKENINGNDYL